MIIDLPAGMPKLRFTIDIFDITLIYSMTSNQYNAWVQVDGITIVEAKGLTPDTDILADTQHTHRIMVANESNIQSAQLQLDYQR